MESHQQLYDVMEKLKELVVETTGVQSDPEGQSDYVCFPDPANNQVEVYIGDYTD